MTDPRTRSWYRNEAQRLRQRAAAVQNDDGLRNSYLSLAREYERLADVLEDRPTHVGTSPSTCPPARQNRRK